MLEHQLVQKSRLVLASEKLSGELKASAWKRSKDAIIVIAIGLIGLSGLFLLVHSASDDTKVAHKTSRASIHLIEK